MARDNGTTTANRSDASSQPPKDNDYVTTTTSSIKHNSWNFMKSGFHRFWGLKNDTLEDFGSMNNSAHLNKEERTRNTTSVYTATPLPPTQPLTAYRGLSDTHNEGGGLFGFDLEGVLSKFRPYKRYDAYRKYVDNSLLNYINAGNNETTDHNQTDEEQRETQVYDFLDGEGDDNLTATSTFSSPIYNFSTLFLMECLRLGRTIYLQPVGGVFNFTLEKGDHFYEDIAASDLRCSMTMVLPRNVMLVMEWSRLVISDVEIQFAVYQTAPGTKFRFVDVIFSASCCEFGEWNRKVISAAGNQLWMELKVMKTKKLLRQAHVFRFNFTLVHKSTLTLVELVSTSPRTGYVQSRGFDGHTFHLLSMMDVWTEIRGPPGMISMFNIPLYHVSPVSSCFVGVLSLHTCRHDDCTVASTCSSSPISPFIIDRSTLYAHFTRIRRVSTPVKGFRLQFSFHEERNRLQKMSKHQWNCSVAHWPDYRQHFPCNLISDCVDGNDEIDCPYTSLRCESGQFLAAERCYIYSHHGGNTELTWNTASLRCHLSGGQLISLNTLDEWEAVQDRLTEYRHSAAVRIGLRSTMDSMSQIYRRSLQQADGSIAYHFYLDFKPNPKPLCMTIFVRISFDEILGDGCNEERSYDYVCEMGPAAGNTTKLTERKKQPSGALNISSMLTLREGSAFNATLFASCPDGHLTHVYLACDVQSACWTHRDASCSAPINPHPPSFSCGDALLHVPYSLVCDFRSDCNDNSDESFCDHLPCLPALQFECQNTQCVGKDKLCDHVEDCLDESDEVYCAAEEIGTRKTAVSGPAYVSFTLSGEVVLVPLGPESDLSHTHRCPNQYFSCDSSPLCFPVFTRCNDVYDCPGREDESGCDGSFKCPGLFRCRASRVCVAPSELCDGIYHCPQHDDEVMCGLSCPATCTCHGLAFFCRGPFSSFGPGEYQQLRYLDASGSGLQFSGVAINTMLIYLSLARCGLRELEFLVMPNLHSLDLSDNLLTKVTDQSISGMPHLRQLTLAANPFKSIFAQSSGNSSSFLSKRILSLDLSRVTMTLLTFVHLSIFPKLETLNLSGCLVDTLDGSGLQAPKALRVLDMRGCPMTYFQANFFQNLRALKELSADNYKLCCPLVLPSDFNAAHCKAPSDEVSSCENLLRSNVYRVFLVLFAGLALSGNIVVFLSRVVLSKARNGFDVFTAMLCVSDFLMGIYLAIIGVADRLYLGSYLWNDIAWRHSISCSLAGFLSMVSNEVSAFIICLITLDRFLVLRFPLSNVRFNKTSGTAVCGFVWVVGVTLAAIPLLPHTAHWRFYAVNGICVPLPITRQDFPGHRYSFGLLIVFNFVLFLLVAVGQHLIYQSVQKNSLRVGSSSNNTKSNSRDLALARRLILIAVTDFVCWFPIGLLGFLASSGVSISGELNVAMAIFVLPLNSAINPFLYTVNRMLETRRVKREQRLMNQLLKQAKQQAAIDHAKSSAYGD